jgi:hypothetical protein
MGLMLKFEVELVMVLSHIYGFDLRKTEERQVAFLLASVGTYDAKSGGNFLVDAAKAEGVAIWNYAPRQLSKVLVSVLTKIALLSVSKSFLRALSDRGDRGRLSMNKVLTQNVGGALPRRPEEATRAEGPGGGEGRRRRARVKASEGARLRSG